MIENVDKRLNSQFGIRWRVLWHHKELRRLGAILVDVCANACGNVAYFRVQLGRDGPTHGAVLLSWWISQCRNAQICALRWGAGESLPGESAALWTGFIWIPHSHIGKCSPILEQVHQKQHNKVRSPDQLDSSRWKQKSSACSPPPRSPQRISLCAGSCAADTASESAHVGTTWANKVDKKVTLFAW